MMRIFKKVLIFSLLTTFFINCGGSEKKKEEKPKPQVQKKMKKEVPEVVELEISGNDLMKFDKPKLTVYEGQTVKLTLKHTGKLPAKAMGHNIVILKKGVDVNEFGGKAIAAKDNQYIPKDALGDIIAYSKVIGGGESTTIEFTAPLPGIYKFICSFPGHYAMMKGNFIVKRL